VKRRAILEVVTPHAEVIHHMPRGFAFADELLAEQISRALETDDETLWLRRCVYHLERRFQRWLQMRLIEPLSWVGLIKVVRHRIRSYPTFIMGGQTYTGRDLTELEAFIRRQVGSMLED
jgi:hypothetical protein